MGSNPDELSDLRRRLAELVPDPAGPIVRSVGPELVEFLAEHLESLAARPLGGPASRPTMEHLLREPPPREGAAWATVWAEFLHTIYPYSTPTYHPRFFGFIPSSPSTISILAEWVAAAINVFAGTWIESAGAAQAELVVLDWFKEFLGYPAGAAGVLLSGGSVANITALVAARDRLAPGDRPRAVLYGSDQTHSSVPRAARIIGLRPDQLRSIPSGPDYRLNPAALIRQIDADTAAGQVPWCVAANAGTTNAGRVDPLEEVADLCARRGLWLHVDAAYGWSAALTERGRDLLRGIERADSITLDPHKWFFQPYEAGCLLVRDAAALRRPFAVLPEYLQDVAAAHGQVNFCDLGPQLTRSFRALKIWMAIKYYGVDWFRRAIDRCLDLARYAHARIAASPVLRPLCPTELSIVCFRFDPGDRDEAELERINRAIVAGLAASGTAFLSSTRLSGRLALRLCFVNHRTTWEDVDRTIEVLEQLGGRGFPGKTAEAADMTRREEIR